MKDAHQSHRAHPCSTKHSDGVRWLVWLGAVACGAPAPPQSPSAPAVEGTARAPSAEAIAAAKTGIGALGTVGGEGGGDLAHASATALRLIHIDATAKPDFDGVPREWARSTLLSDVLSGAPKAQGAVTVEYDEEAVYVGGEIEDGSFTRTDRFGDQEDRVVLTVAFPVGGGTFVPYEINFFPGIPGETQGSVRFGGGGRKGKEVPGGRIVEAPRAEGGIQTGYTFEAAIPWSTFAEARTTRVGLRGSVRYVDADVPGRLHGVRGTGRGDAAHVSELPPLPTEPEQILMDGFLQPRGIDFASPKLDVFADVAGDGRKERIAVFGEFLVMLGPGYRQGQQFFVRQLAGELRSIEARDMTGRGKSDLVVRARSRVGSTTREVAQIWSTLGGDEPTTIFSHELAIADGSRRVSNGLRFLPTREVEVSIEPATGWDASSFHAPRSSDVEPVLLPWGRVKARTFKFDGKSFTAVREVSQPGVDPTGTDGTVATSPVQPTSARAAATAAASVSSPTRGASPPPVPTPTQLFEAFKRDRGLAPSAAPRFDIEVNVAEDKRPEHVALFDRNLVVAGPGYQGGARYAFVTLQPFATGADVSELTARDLTGNGSAEVIVKGVRRVTPSGATSAVEMEVLLVYAVDGSQIRRIFAVETARAEDGRRLQGVVQFVPGASGRGFDIEVKPGRVTGWTEKTYPWTQEKPGASAGGAGGVEPLVLPWSGLGALRYAWNGKEFVRK